MWVIKWGTLGVLNVGYYGLWVIPIWCLKKLWLGLCWTIRTIYRHYRPPPSTFGNDSLATPKIMKKNGLFKQEGYIIGKIKRGNFWKEIFMGGEGHATVVAPTRSGKGVNFVIPNCLEHLGSLIALDVKGEIHDTTVDHRRTLGDVFNIDLINPHLSHGFNPFDTVVIGSGHEVIRATTLAKLLVTCDRFGLDHWDQKTIAMYTGLILYIKYAKPPELQNLVELWKTVREENGPLEYIVEEMKQMPYATTRAAAKHLGHLLTTNEGKSVISSMVKSLELWTPDNHVSNILKRSDFSISQFKRKFAPST